MSFFLKLDEHSIRNALYPQIDSSAANTDDKIQGKNGITGPSVAGYMALTIDEVKEFHATNKIPIIFIMNGDYSPEHNEILPLIDGMVMLGKGTKHIGILAKGYEFPIIFLNRDDNVDLEVKDNVLYADHNGTLSEFARAGHKISIDGSNYTLYNKELPIEHPSQKDLNDIQQIIKIAKAQRILTWHDANKQHDDFTALQVWGNANNTQDVQHAVDAGAMAIFLRTENLLLSNDLKLAFAVYILSDHSQEKAKKEAEKILYDVYFEELKEIYEITGNDIPVNVRLLDAPISEFIPTNDQFIDSLNSLLNSDSDQIRQQIKKLQQDDLRGAQFALNYDGFYQLQARAIFSAAKAQNDNANIPIKITLSNIINQDEVIKLFNAINTEASSFKVHTNKTISHENNNWQLGIMLETKQMLNNPIHSRNFTTLVNYAHIGSNDLIPQIIGYERGDETAMQAYTIETGDNPAEMIPYAIRDQLAQKIAEHKIAEISLCGAHATNRSTIEWVQAQGWQAISVPATYAEITNAIINAARTSVLEHKKHQQQIVKNRQANNRQNPVDTTTTTTEHLSIHDSTPKTIIIIDDDEYTRDYVEQTITNEFGEMNVKVMKCDTPDDGEIEIQKSCQNGTPPDLIITDNLAQYDMKKIIDGYKPTYIKGTDLINQILQNPDNYPGFDPSHLILMSSHTPHENSDLVKTWDKSSPFILIAIIQSMLFTHGKDESKGQSFVNRTSDKTGLKR